MMLRSHQAALAAICDEILAGAPIRQIIASVTPGGGKSKLPVILADKLIPAIADKILWVVPRNSLKVQGEAEFLDATFPTRRRMRAANGNEANPARGADGYLTTYQAVGQSPEEHLRFCREHRTILFLDESHHVGDGRTWAEAMAPIRDAAVLVVDASGTLARGDGQKIAGLEYEGGYVDLSDREHVRIIRYSRTDAIAEGSILPIVFHHLDGRAEWENEEGQRLEADTLSAGETAGAALFTALRTDFAFDMLDDAIDHWKKHKAASFPEAKFLVVSPSIELAKLYQSHLARRRIDSLVATSDDGPAAQEAILRFKGLSLPSVDALVTCQLAYEGLSVPPVSHIACLTHIRSVPWLEQCFARANRRFPGKTAGHVWGPADARLREAIASIEAEQILALEERRQGKEGGGDAGEGSGGGGNQRIRPLSSEAIRFQNGASLDFGPEGLVSSPDAAFVGAQIPPLLPQDGGLTASQAEKFLRHQIAQHIEIVLGRVRPGSKQAYSTIIHRRLKGLVGGKKREELTADELARQWGELKARWPV